jgi:predicted signal transduction protein with EAL and GGDEF domain
MGHEIGDQLLIKIADKMNSCVQDDEMIFRHGGDEFTILVPDTSINKAKAISEKVVDELSVPILIDQYELIISPSIGIVVYPHHGNSPKELIKNADLAMYFAKSTGANNYKIFTKELLVHSQNKVELEMDLRKALERGEFVLHYQPQFHLKTQKMIGVEALIRWNHPKKGMISPLEFIPFAEESGLIIPIGEWAIREACLQNKTWQQSGYPSITVSVNLSPRQFQSNIVETIQSVLLDTELEAKYLELEITESIMMEVNKAISTLKELKKLGVKVSIDDFGTGYSSLYYLKKFPIDKLKIDQSFIRDIAHSNDETLIKTIIIMAHTLNLQVIAEGVETKKHVDLLTSLNCNEAQGFYFSKPVPATELEITLRQF